MTVLTFLDMMQIALFQNNTATSAQATRSCRRRRRWSSGSLMRFGNGRGHFAVSAAHARSGRYSPRIDALGLDASVGRRRSRRCRRTGISRGTIWCRRRRRRLSGLRRNRHIFHDTFCRNRFLLFHGGNIFGRLKRALFRFRTLAPRRGKVASLGRIIRWCTSSSTSTVRRRNVKAITGTSIVNVSSGGTSRRCHGIDLIVFWKRMDATTTLFLCRLFVGGSCAGTLDHYKLRLPNSLGSECYCAFESLQRLIVLN